MMYTARTKPALGNLESPALPKNDLTLWDSHICKLYLGMPMWSIIKSKDTEWTNDLHTLCIHRHKDHGMPTVTGNFIFFYIVINMAPHENGNLAARVSRARGPPFVPVDNDMIVSIILDGSFHIGGVRGCHGRLCHGKA